MSTQASSPCMHHSQWKCLSKTIKPKAKNEHTNSAPEHHRDPHYQPCRQLRPSANSACDHHSTDETLKYTCSFEHTGWVAKNRAFHRSFILNCSKYSNPLSRWKSV